MFASRSDQDTVNFNGMSVTANASLIANAGVAFQSPLTSILEDYAPFGANYNLKGLFTLGPYFDVKAQLQAQATMSGAVTGVASMTVPGGKVSSCRSNGVVYSHKR